MSTVLELIPGGVVVYVSYREERSWHYCSIQKWEMSTLSQWDINLSNELDEIGDEFVNKVLSNCKVSKNQLKATIQKLIEEGNELQAFFLTPLISADFDNKKLVSHYFDVSVETLVLNGWQGEYSDVRNLIPEKEHYWKAFTL